jgi:hypothetical protein
MNPGEPSSSPAPGLPIETRSSFIESDLKRFTYFAAGVVLGTSGLYLVLFWHRFGIAPFQHIAFSDIAPLASPFLLFGLGIVAIIAAMELMLPYSTAAPTRPDSYRKYVIALALSALATSFVAFYLADYVIESVVLMMFYSSMAVASLVFKGLLRIPNWDAFFKTTFARRVACLLAVYLPISAIFMAHYDSTQIKERREYKYMLANDLKESNLGYASNFQLVLIGKLGNTYVFDVGRTEKLFVPSEAFRIFRLRDHRSTK